MWISYWLKIQGKSSLTKFQKTITLAWLFSHFTILPDLFSLISQLQTLFTTRKEFVLFISLLPGMFMKRKENVFLN